MDSEFIKKIKNNKEHISTGLIPKKNVQKDAEEFLNRYNMSGGLIKEFDFSDLVFNHFVSAYYEGDKQSGLITHYITDFLSKRMLDSAEDFEKNFKVHFSSNPELYSNLEQEVQNISGEVMELLSAGEKALFSVGILHKFHSNKHDSLPEHHLTSIAKAGYEQASVLAKDRDYSFVFGDISRSMDFYKESLKDFSDKYIFQ